jgi:hypothetical protein
VKARCVMDKLTSTTPEEPREGAAACKVNLADADIEQINRRLSQVVLSLIAIEKLAIQAIDGDPEMSPHWMFAIEEMAKANVRGIDACLERMGGHVYTCGPPELES